ncbi:hypothetical protein O5166_26395, partial [Escherichia coli]|nr:hypothetical protein [Escherichia coli]
LGMSGEKCEVDALTVVMRAEGSGFARLSGLAVPSLKPSKLIGVNSGKREYQRRIADTLLSAVKTAPDAQSLRGAFARF